MVFRGYCNEQSFTFNHQEENELIGKKAKEVFLSKSDRYLLTKQNIKRINGVTGSYELKVKNKLGQQKDWLISGAPNLNLNGDYLGSIGN